MLHRLIEAAYWKEISPLRAAKIEKILCEIIIAMIMRKKTFNISSECVLPRPRLLQAPLESDTLLFDLTNSVALIRPPPKFSGAETRLASFICYLYGAGEGSIV